MCGENDKVTVKKSCKAGSPPRVRGKLKKQSIVKAFIGITPACAGKTYSGLQPVRLPEDHPRVCGENSAALTKSLFQRGSPPRVRGKHILKRLKKVLLRITPACAGKTLRDRSKATAPGDHPRVCGENAGVLGVGLSVTGSPPRVRGKLVRKGLVRQNLRITPACAGKTDDDREQSGYS